MPTLLGLSSAPSQTAGNAWHVLVHMQQYTLIVLSASAQRADIGLCACSGRRSMSAYLPLGEPEQAMPGMCLGTCSGTHSVSALLPLGDRVGGRTTARRMLPLGGCLPIFWRAGMTPGNAGMSPACMICSRTCSGTNRVPVPLGGLMVQFIFTTVYVFTTVLHFFTTPPSILTTLPSFFTAYSQPRASACSLL
jgi:hypothetical protein